MKFRHLSNCNQIIGAVCRIFVPWIAMENYDGTVMLLVFVHPRPFQPNISRLKAVETSEISINRFSTAFSRPSPEK